MNHDRLYFQQLSQKMENNIAPEGKIIENEILSDGIFSTDQMDSSPLSNIPILEQ